MNMVADTKDNAAPSPLFKHHPKLKTLRSKVTNGVKVFAIGGDGRSAWTRRWRDIYDEHIADLGGADLLSEAQKSICRRCAAMEVELEQLEAKFSEGAIDADLDLYARVSGHLSRLFAAIGIERRARPVEPAPTLSEIASGLAGRPNGSKD